ncbi:antibiotic biosynthesis monooxygenase [Streptomyces sp. NPDC005438]|uniref:antibiotic biosynthesis monooxygenase family protein n=1 Tax=Streptomyces sp. NPDC005438 TaxID=3156880 RepID=UPI0033A24573
MSIVKINVLTVPEDRREVLEQRFGARAGTVEKAEGFEGFQLLRPVDGTDKYLVCTWWRDEASFQAWMEGPMKEAHQGGQGGGQGGERPKPAATDSTVWSFEVALGVEPGTSGD